MGKRFVLTYAGEQYLFWLNRLNNVQEDMLKEMHELANAEEGRIRVGIPLSGSDMLVSEILPAFYKRYPKVAVEIHQAQSKTLRSMLGEGSVDYIIVPDRYLNGEMVAERLGEIHMALALAANHPAIEKTVKKEGFRYLWLDLRELKNERFLVPSENPDTFHILERVPDEYGFKPYIVRQTRHFSSTLVNCVANGLGVTFCSDLFLIKRVEKGELCMLSYGERSFYHYLVIAHHKNHYVDSAAEYFIQLCKGVYK